MTFNLTRRSFTAALLSSTIAAAVPMSAVFAQAKKTLTMAIGTAGGENSVGLDNLDPRVLTSTNHMAVQTAMFESLVRANGNKIEPGMAEKWEVSADGKTYTFTLRDAKWSDGKPVTGGDFVHAFVRMFETSPASSIYDDILNGAELRGKTAKREDLGVKAPDDKTVVITLKNPVPYFLGLVSSTFASPGREDLVTKFGDAYGASVESLPSNGPFVLVQWENEDKLVLKKNPDYWNAANIKLDEVVFLVVPEDGTKRNMFDNGEIDLYIPVTETESSQYETEGKLVRYDRGGVRDVHLNRHGQNDPVKAKLLSNPNFMKAISYAVDRQGFVDKVLQGAAIPATVQTPRATAIYPGKSWGEVSPNYGKFHPEAADMAKSKEYLDKALAEAGVALADLPKFDLLTSESPENPKVITPYFFSVLTALGLKVEMHQATGKQFYNNLYKPALAYDFAVAGWGPDFDDPYTYMGYWNSSSMDMGVTYENKEFDDLLNKANAETDLVKRAEILGQAEAKFSDDAPCIPLLHWKGAMALQPRVKNLTTAMFGATFNYIHADVTE
ncbi:peptide ABC transporter substrate-binding protein [Nordella sp. HKS 07]|uniref:peptide ABC transporter substrate-binding protein n=1 Tax=Nordella sp. HKS 07 TaxID=2712222 RepID=UPI0013E10BFC|nr:peptide ABC transporter substrate-binding protein [Nordella sp. HKS 07]QIG48775.1 peptide ABC transporter substrate-binding protein [Nordella sp. HKS 07]